MASRIMAIANQKGGVGKTTTTLGLAAAVADSGGRVLVIDMDPQANASQTLLSDYDQLAAGDDFFTSNDILESGVEPSALVSAIRQTPWTGVDLIPSEQALAHRDVEGVTGIEQRLRVMLKGLPQDTYDVVLLDCPPSVGRLTVNALIAAQEILLVSGPDRYGHTALDHIEETMRNVLKWYGHDIEVAGLVVNLFENTTEAERRTNELRQRFREKLRLVMPKRTVLSLAAGQHQSVFFLNRPDAAQVAGLYRQLAADLGLEMSAAAAVAR